MWDDGARVYTIHTKRDDLGGSGLVYAAVAHLACVFIIVHITIIICINNTRNVTYIARDVHTWRSFCTYLFIFFQLAAGHPTLQSADTAAAGRRLHGARGANVQETAAAPAAADGVGSTRAEMKETDDDDDEMKVK